MLVNFETLPEDSKVWIYPSSRKFYPNEIEEVETKLKEFVENWKKEDEAFIASYKFLYKRFLVFTANDDNSVLTNLEVDALVSFILELQSIFNIELLDKMNVCFKQGEFVQYKELKDFKKLLKNKAVTGKTIIFDNLITTKIEFENYWEVAIEDSWYSRFL